MKIPLLIVICLNSALAAKKCYQCTTSIDLKCGDPFNGVSTECVNTNHETINCVKYIYELSGLKHVYRGCRELDDTCDDIKKAVEMEGGKFLDCSMCSTDLCNAASIASIVKIALFVTILLMFFL